MTVGQERVATPSNQSSAASSSLVKKHHYYLLEPSKFTEQERDKKEDREASNQHDKQKSGADRIDTTEEIKIPHDQQNNVGKDQAKKHPYYLLEPSQFLEEQSKSTRQHGTDKQDGMKEEKEQKAQTGDEDLENDWSQGTDHIQP